MLVLTRKVSEQIIIRTPEGVEITLTSVEIRGDKMRLGIDAPKDWSIHRKEIQEKIDGNAVPCEGAK